MAFPQKCFQFFDGLLIAPLGGLGGDSIPDLATIFFVGKGSPLPYQLRRWGDEVVNWSSS
jgi:hypothetical protein